jgi:hypothetical protein
MSEMTLGGTKSYASQDTANVVIHKFLGAKSNKFDWR